MVPCSLSVVRVFTPCQSLWHQLGTFSVRGKAYVLLTAVDYWVPIVDEGKDRRIARQLKGQHFLAGLKDTDHWIGSHTSVAWVVVIAGCQHGCFTCNPMKTHSRNDPN